MDWEKNLRSSSVEKPDMDFGFYTLLAQNVTAKVIELETLRKWCMAAGIGWALTH